MALSDDQKITYLANLIAVAGVDGEVTADEQEVIEAARVLISASKEDAHLARERAREPGYELTPVGFFSDRVKNLEYVIYVSVVNGTLHTLEKALLLDFAKQVKVTQEQILSLISDVKMLAARSHDQHLPMENRSVAEGASEVVSSDDVDVEFEKAYAKPRPTIAEHIPRYGVAIEFAETDSKNLAYAIHEYRSAPINSNHIEGGKNWQLAAWPTDQLIEALDLVEYLRDFEQKRVHVDGHLLPWEEVFSFVDCAKARADSEEPSRYCFGLDRKELNIWGCKQTQMMWNGWAEWFGYGAFQRDEATNKTTYLFDKKRIRTALDSQLFKYRYCPHIQFRLIIALLDRFPEQVRPTDKGRWVYLRDYEEKPGAILVQVTSSKKGYSYSEEYYSSGVAPSSNKIGIELLKRAIRASGSREEDVRAILEYKE